MKRYRFLKQEDIYEALNNLRDAFLAAKNGTDVEKIINGLLTNDEKLKLGRRIIIAKIIHSGLTIEEISKTLRVGKNTVVTVIRLLEENPECFDLIKQRGMLVEREYKAKRYKKIGGSTLVFKKNEYTGFKRKDVTRE